MKAFTDIEQSKKLVEILPIESVDMCYRIVAYNPNDTHEYQPYCFVSTLESDIPCWSLAALLSVLPLHLIVDNQRYAFNMIKGLDKNGETYAIKYTIFNTTFYFHLTDFYNNPVDACVEMILKLHEQKLL